MGEAVKGTRRAYSVGNLILYVQPLTLVADASTHASGVGGVVSYWVNSTGRASVNEKTGADVAESSGTFTFAMPDKTYGKNVDLYYMSTELE